MHLFNFRGSSIQFYNAGFTLMGVVIKKFLNGENWHEIMLR